jgi:uncharacterized membrane protein YbhN (UPF0104 family)
MISTAHIPTRPAASAVAWIGRQLPKGWGDLARNLAIFAVFDVLYEMSRIVATGDRADAMRHAHSIVSTEQSLGMFHELDLQRWAMGAPSVVLDIANWTYFNCQFTISFGFLFWVYLKRNEVFPLVRNIMIAANAIGMLGYVFYPAAPPRMLSGLGFVDTLHQTSVNHDSGAIHALANPYAAMPSLHTAYALIVGVSAVLLVRNRVLRSLWAFYPALVVFSIVVTANHFFLDAAGGAGVAAIAALAVFAARTRSRKLAAAMVAVPVASFLVYRLAGQAVEVADALKAVALGSLALAIIANLVSVWLKTAVWQRSLAVLPGTPRLGVRALLPAVFIGFLFNTVLAARLGEVARGVVLHRRARAEGAELGAAAIAGTLLAEQLVLGLALVILGAALALTIVDLPGWAISSLIALGALTLGAAIAGFLVRRANIPLPSSLARLAGPARSVLNGASGLLSHPRQALLALLLGVLSWVAQIAGIWWTLDAFGLPHGIEASAAVFLVSTLVGIFPIMPGNVGVFQFAVAGVLASSFGVAAAPGAAFAIGLQATEVALGAGIGALYLLTEGVSFAEIRRRSSLPASAGCGF